MRIKRFEWDKWNASHIAERHGLSPEVVEEVFCNRLVVRRVRGGRFAAYGQTDDGRVSYGNLSSQAQQYCPCGYGQGYE